MGVKYDCSCWVKYPNPLQKKGTRWKCVDCYECVQDLKGTYGRGNKTKCIRKERKNDK